MNEQEYIDIFRFSAKNFYDTVKYKYMPILLLYLAMENRYKIITNKQSVPKGNWKVLSSLTRTQLEENSRFNIAALDLHNHWKRKNIESMDICVKIANTEILDSIFQVFKRLDKEKGTHYVNTMFRLAPHAYEYALLSFARNIEGLDRKWIRANWCQLFFELYDLSSIAPQRERLKAAKIQKQLIGNVKGIVYHPYSSIPFIAPLLNIGNRFYADIHIDKEDDYTATKLLMLGAGIKEFTNIDHHNSQVPRSFPKGAELDCVICNSPDRISTCLEYAQHNLSAHGKFVGIVQYRLIDTFFHDERNCWILTQDRLSKIIKIDGRELLIFVDMQKPSDGKVEVIVSQDMQSTFTISIVDLLDKNKKFRQLFLPAHSEKHDKTLRPLGDHLTLFNKVPPTMTRGTYYMLDFLSTKEEDVLDEKNTITMPVLQRFCYGFSMRHGSYRPTYLITPNSGKLRPALFFSNSVEAYFDQGNAFNVRTKKIYEYYLLNELKKQYIWNQLNPLRMLPSEVDYSEEDILSIMIYVPNGSSDREIVEKEVCIVEEEAEQIILPDGYQLVNSLYGAEKTIYTIADHLSSGSFGITYLVDCTSAAVGTNKKVADDDKQVAIKELFVSSRYKRSPDGRAIPYSKVDYFHDENTYIQDFIDEYKKIEALGKAGVNHIMQVKDFFFCKDTNTYYYTMPYYRRGSLQMLLDNTPNHRLPEAEVIRDFIIPVSQALYGMHTMSEPMIHFDVKPENITIDDDGTGVLIDFGLCRKYDTKGELSKSEQDHQTGGAEFYYPYVDETDFQLDPYYDIYALGVTLFEAVTGIILTPEDMQEYLNTNGENYLSPAIVRVLQLLIDYPQGRDRFRSIPDFIHQLPGCAKVPFKQANISYSIYHESAQDIRIAQESAYSKGSIMI